MGEFKCERVVLKGFYPPGHERAGEAFEIAGWKCCACGRFLGESPPSEHACYAIPWNPIGAEDE